MRLTLLEISRLLGCPPAAVLPTGTTPTPGAAEIDDAPWAGFAPSGAQIDSRLVAPGQLFFCLKGEQVDGHDFAGAAALAGACAVIAERAPFAPGDGGIPVFLVPDTVAALARLAICHRETAPAGVVGITVSAG